MRIRYLLVPELQRLDQMDQETLAPNTAGVTSKVKAIKGHRRRRGRAAKEAAAAEAKKLRRGFLVMSGI